MNDKNKNKTFFRRQKNGNDKKTITDYETAGFTGVDVNLSISLFEYGLIWHENDIDGDTKFIYGIGANNNCEYNLFDYGFYNEKDFADLISDGSWFKIDDVLSCCGSTKEEWLKMPLGHRIFDCIAYYGVENIFGSSYNGFEIEDN